MGRRHSPKRPAPVIPQAPPSNTDGASSAANTTSEKCSVEGGGSGSGFSLPDLVDIQWEKRTDRPGFSCWHTPQGTNASRQTKTYLGYVGKRLLAEWEALPDDQRRAVAGRLTEKGCG
jgi:hypothetical protein